MVDLTGKGQSAASLAATAFLVGANLAGLYYLIKNHNQGGQQQEDDDDKGTDRSSVSIEDNNKSVPNQISLSGETKETDYARILSRNTITIVHGSITGTCLKQAERLERALRKNPKLAHTTTIQLGRIDEFDWWDELLNDEDDDEQEQGDKKKKKKNKKAMVLVVMVPTHTGGAWPVTAEALHTALQDLGNDWRIQKAPLRPTGLHVAVFGMGSSAYDEETMGQPAHEAMRLLQSLGAQTMGKVSVGDNAVGTHADRTFRKWMKQTVRRVEELFLLPTKEQEEACGCKTTGTKTEEGQGCCQQQEPQESTQDRSYDDDEDDQEYKEPTVMDMEDMGESMMQQSSSEVREMVTPSQAAALKKEGYKLIGTHSAVKLCRWTKHQLRGRGGCYKHTFYGITSYQCMEATPSLACANKCMCASALSLSLCPIDFIHTCCCCCCCLGVFCWRHHKNPVGKEWRWKTDDPFVIVDEAVKTHVKMIKEAKGIPGVKMDRWREAHRVRHCALSLVGEPIMYPRIDELLGELHHRDISTFLVTNGQHPQAIQTIRPITQLYVSVDAPTNESLIAIDRPLFQDAWDRLKESLQALRQKGQRTVARLTVVKGWNSDEIEGYAKLIALGHVSLVEIKGVTFCGKSDASNLNMSNTPWHHEVVAIARNLQTELNKMRQEEKDSTLPEYDLACEHKHSCSVLLARVDQFCRVDPSTGARTWRTWIDYDRFQELAARNAADPSFTFRVQDYTAETPSWALMGSTEEGFDPTDTRHRKKTKHPKYTRFDADGVPTHDHNHEELSPDERQRLEQMMKAKRQEIGSSGTTVTELRGGEKEIQDASLMFRGMVITK